MVNAVYDHLVAIVIVGIIFIGAVVALPALTFSNLQTVDEQQLRNTALNVFDSMLLSVGSPSDWGTTYGSEIFDPTTVEFFGLASSGPLSKFVLDSDKVQRIDPENPTGVIGYDDVRRLLNIEDQYGFQLSIFRPFLVDWSLHITNNMVYYSVNVTRTEDRTPIPNAEVKVTTTLALTDSTKGKDDYEVVQLETVTDKTDVMGKCEGYQSCPGVTISHAFSIMTITVAGMPTTVIAHTDNPFVGVIKVNTSGDNIILSFPEELVGNDTHSERRIEEIDVYVSEELFSLFQDGTSQSPPDVKITHGSGYEYWTLNYPGLRAMDPTALVFWVQVTLKGYGRVLVVVAGTLDFGDPGKIFDFGPEPTSKRVIAIMRRLVVISDMTYVAQIAFWRE